MATKRKAAKNGNGHKGKKRIAFKPQRHNINKHTDIGTRELGASIKRDGYIGAITVAADGESFDGSNRLVVGGKDFDNAVIVHSTGAKPVVVIRDDIPNTNSAKAKRLGFVANQIGAMDWNPDADILAAIAKDDDLVAALIAEDEHLAELLKGADAPDFKEYDESIADGVTVCKCERCGHEHAKKD